MRIIKKGKSSTLIKGKYFRVHTISKLISSDYKNHTITIKCLEPKEGLGIEYKASEDSYKVFLFLKYDKEKNKVIFDLDVESLLEDLSYLKDDLCNPIAFYEAIDEFYNIISFAKEALLDMNDIQEE